MQVQQTGQAVKRQYQVPLVEECVQLGDLGPWSTVLIYILPESLITYFLDYSCQAGRIKSSSRGNILSVLSVLTPTI